MLRILILAFLLLLHPQPSDAGTTELSSGEAKRILGDGTIPGPTLMQGVIITRADLGNTTFKRTSEIRGASTIVEVNELYFKQLQAGAEKGLLRIGKDENVDGRYSIQATEKGRKYLSSDGWLLQIPGPRIVDLNIVKIESKQGALQTYALVYATFRFAVDPMYIALDPASAEKFTSSNGDRKLMVLFKYDEFEKKWSRAALDIADKDKDFRTHNVENLATQISGHR